MPPHSHSSPPTFKKIKRIKEIRIVWEQNTYRKLNYCFILITSRAQYNLKQLRNRSRLDQQVALAEALLEELFDLDMELNLQISGATVKASHTKLEKIVSRLAILGVIIAQEDLNSNFLSSLPPEWNTHVVVWMNKPEVETISIDDLYNNFKIVEQKVKKSVGTSSGAQNLAFMTAPSTSSTNDANTASPQVSAASPNVNAASLQVCTASVSDNTVYAFMVENPNGSTSLPTPPPSRRQNPDSCNRYSKGLSPNVSALFASVGAKCTIRGQQEIFIIANDTAGYYTQYNKQESTVVWIESDNSKENSDESLVEEQVLQDKRSFVESSPNVDKETVFPVIKKIEFSKPKNHEKPVLKSQVRPKAVNTARSYTGQVNAVRVKGVNAVKFLACWVWRPTKPNVASTHVNKGFVNSGCLRHMTGNIAYLSDFKEFNRGYVAFGGGAYGGRITAEAVSTACYVQNRVLVVKPQNKTPYELFRGFKPALSFMRPFGCHVTILNTLDSLGKFDGKSDEGFLVGYSLSSKAFRVYNTRTRRIEENLHIGFLENKPTIEGNGPKWLFDIDSLTQSMNYVPVTTSTLSNDSTSTSEENIQDCIAMPIWKDTSYFDSPTKDVDNGEPKIANDTQKQVEDGLNNKNAEQERVAHDSSTKDVITTGQQVNTTSPDVNTASLKLNVVGPSVNTASPNEEDSTE
ncbi:retrovirus-related pol polyprotein from transposon TNT 1-94 [Tanacetum coccineum]